MKKSKKLLFTGILLVSLFTSATAAAGKADCSGKRIVLAGNEEASDYNDSCPQYKHPKSLPVKEMQA